MPPPRPHGAEMSQVVRKRADRVAADAAGHARYLRFLVYSLETAVRAMGAGQEQWGERQRAGAKEGGACCGCVHPGCTGQPANHAPNAPTLPGPHSCAPPPP